MTMWTRSRIFSFVHHRMVYGDHCFPCRLRNGEIVRSVKIVFELVSCSRTRINGMSWFIMLQDKIFCQRCT